MPLHGDLLENCAVPWPRQMLLPRGEGVPPWFSDLATPSKVGNPLEPLPGPQTTMPTVLEDIFNAFTHCVSFHEHSTAGFKHLFNTSDGLCGTNDTHTWAMHAGEVDYNTRNPCCTRFNSGGESWSRLAFTWQATAAESMVSAGSTYIR